MSSAATTSTWSSVRAETGTTDAQRMPSFSSREAIFTRCSTMRAGLTRSDLVASATSAGGLGSLAISPIRNSSPGPIRWLAGKHTPITSTSDQVA